MEGPPSEGGHALVNGRVHVVDDEADLRGMKSGETGFWHEILFVVDASSSPHREECIAVGYELITGWNRKSVP